MSTNSVMDILQEPKQITEWKFLKELAKPATRVFRWNRTFKKAGEVDIRTGVKIIRHFPDPEKLLDTAYADLSRFFEDGGISAHGEFEIITSKADTEGFESYRIEVSNKSCRIIAGDTEGIRRGIFHFEDMLLSSDGPFLSRGEIERKPWVKTRISRCFFGPIKRPPFNRDELIDDFDYYPDEYLNRLAHEGINGLWLSISFRDLCRTSMTPEYGKDAKKRLAKLRRTVEKCRRYGIRIYVFCIEPAALEQNDPLLKRYPELAGTNYAGKVCFCPFSKTAQTYLYEAVSGIFSAVPDLGGMINISLGERLTTCLSACAITGIMPKCPRCAKKLPWEILHASLSAMERGMRSANPDAELISWLYVPLGTGGKLYSWIGELASHVPENVILQYNFESGGLKEQLNRTRFAADYWLSYVGPSDIFKNIAESARKNGTSVYAKLQVGCSHEVASVPYVPVPLHLYRKYKAMRKLGISGVMQCWYFGSCPGLMNKAAGELSFEPFPESEDEFLETLARVDWGSYAKEAVTAWKQFSQGYENYPLTVMFQYYGPMHDGVVWPLHLGPVNKPLSPTWRLDYPPSGDRIGECMNGSHTIEESLILCRELAEKWSLGVKILRRMKSSFSNCAERLRDMGVAEALGIQFRSGYNILRFYDLREQMIDDNTLARLVLLEEMEKIVREEISLDEALIELCEKDSRLGFHPEAEGYKYFPEKIGWRIGLLKVLLENDFPAVRDAIEHGKTLFPEYTGKMGSVKEYVCGSGRIEKCGAFEWKADCTGESVCFQIKCEKPVDSAEYDHDILRIYIEARRLWPVLDFNITQNGCVPGLFAKHGDCETKLSETPSEWNAEVMIPFRVFGENTPPARPARINIVREFQNSGKSKQYCWVRLNPLKERLKFGSFNPDDMGCLRFR